MIFLTKHRHQVGPPPPSSRTSASASLKKSSKSLSLDETFESKLEKLKQVEMPCDGHCMYHTIIEGMKKEGLKGPTTVDDMRRVVVKWVNSQANPTNSQRNARIRAEGGIGKKRVGEPFWGRDDELEVLSHALGVSFLVFETEMRHLPPTRIGDDTNNVVITMINIKNEHYNLLVPK